MKSVPLAASLPLTGCLESITGGRGDRKPYPEEWRHVDPFDSEYVTFEPGEFETTASDPPAEGDTLSGDEVWKLVEEMADALEEASFQLAFEFTRDSLNQETTLRRSLWRNVETGVVYQRDEVDRAREPVHTIRVYDDGTRYKSVQQDGETEYYHTTDPLTGHYRVDSTWMGSIFQVPDFRAVDTVTVDGTELRRVRHTDDLPEGMRTESAAFFVGEDGIVRNGHAEYGTEPEVPRTEQFSVDGAVDIEAGRPAIGEPEWTDEAVREEQQPSERSM